MLKMDQKEKIDLKEIRLGDKVLQSTRVKLRGWRNSVTGEWLWREESQQRIRSLDAKKRKF